MSSENRCISARVFPLSACLLGLHFSHSFLLVNTACEACSFVEDYRGTRGVPLCLCNHRLAKWLRRMWSNFCCAAHQGAASVLPLRAPQFRPESELWGLGAVRYEPHRFEAPPPTSPG